MVINKNISKRGRIKNLRLKRRSLAKSQQAQAQVQAQPKRNVVQVLKSGQAVKIDHLKVAKVGGQDNKPKQKQTAKRRRLRSDPGADNKRVSRLEQARNRRVNRRQRTIGRGYLDKVKALKNVGSGKVLIMIACGPSVKEAPLELLVDHPKVHFMAINNPYGYYKDKVPNGHDKLWPATYWCFCDHSQYNRNKEAFNSFKGRIINSTGVRGAHPSQVVVKNKGGKGFSRDLTVGYHIGRSSTFANMQVAFYMGYDKIYVFGLDMAEVGGKLHHYGVNPDVAPSNRKQRFQGESTYYDFMTKNLKPVELDKFVLCSTYNPWPFMKAFNRLDQKEAPRKILEYVKTI
jgi:hypothetical protein